MAAAYLPLLIRYGGQLWATPGYEMAPVFLLLAVLGAIERVRSLNPAKARYGWQAWVAAGLAVVFLGLAAGASSPELAAASLLVVLMAAALRWGGVQPARELAGPWLLACLLLRLPGDLDLLAFRRIAQLTAATAHCVLDGLGTLHDLDGASILLPKASMWLDASRYGLFSPWSALVLVIAVSVWLRRSGIDILVLLAISGGWFLLLDVLRAVSLVVCASAGFQLQAAAAVVDYFALALLLMLVVSSDSIGLLFGKAVRLANPVRRRRSKAAVIENSAVTVVGLTLDESGRLTKVVSEQRRQPPPGGTQGAELAGGGAAVTPEWLLLAAVYGALLLAQLIWLPDSWAADASNSPSELARRVEMPAELGGWQLESACGSNAFAADPVAQPAGAAASWVYHRGALRFALSLRSCETALADAAEIWRDYGWQIDASARFDDEAMAEAATVPCRRVFVTKPGRPGHACIWTSRWRPGEPFSPEPPANAWTAGAIAAAQRAAEVVRSLGRAQFGAAEQATCQFELSGALVSLNRLSRADLAEGRDLFGRLATTLQRAAVVQAVRP